MGENGSLTGGWKLRRSMKASFSCPPPHKVTKEVISERKKVRRLICGGWRERAKDSNR